MPKKPVTATGWRDRVKAHLLEYGDAEWDKFPWKDELPYHTRRRYVRQIKAELGELKPQPANVRVVQQDLGEKLREANEEAESGQGPIQLMSHVNRMLYICDLLDSHAIDFENGEVNDAQDAREAVKTRSSVLTLAITAQDKLYSSNRVQMVHKLMLDSIRKESPEAAGRILQDLRRIDSEYGLAFV